ncbi:uncharacterized protein LOC125753963 [Canis lupus dingo]|uniref:uncharacterized protein LOC125753963 n=1 Tax=Canis lupus dingo TaxID=286419 RepID=UPI0020C33B7D|nr:uncharacterized protein LOC125753963 [Canis lupus dingo]
MPFARSYKNRSSPTYGPNRDQDHRCPVPPADLARGLARGRGACRPPPHTLGPRSGALQGPGLRARRRPSPRYRARQPGFRASLRLEGRPSRSRRRPPSRGGRLPALRSHRPLPSTHLFPLFQRLNSTVCAPRAPTSPGKGGGAQGWGGGAGRGAQRGRSRAAASPRSRHESHLLLELNHWRVRRGSQVAAACGRWCPVGPVRGASGSLCLGTCSCSRAPDLPPRALRRPHRDRWSVPSPRDRSWRPHPGTGRGDPHPGTGRGALTPGQVVGALTPGQVVASSPRDRSWRPHPGTGRGALTPGQVVAPSPRDRSWRPHPGTGRRRRHHHTLYRGGKAGAAPPGALGLATPQPAWAPESPPVTPLPAHTVSRC